MGGWTFGVPKNGKNQVWAFEFIQMACSKLWMQRSLERGNAPPRVSVLSEPTVAERFGWAPVVAATMKTAKLEPRDPIWPSMDLQPRGAISAVLLGQKTAKVALDGVASDWQRTLKRAGDWRFCQIQLGSKTSEPLGRRKYWPIFEAALKHGFSIGLHIGGTQSSAPSPSGWPQFYIEDHQMLTHSMMNQATSLILEGVFDRFPELKIVLIEGGFGWVPTLGWRLDAHWSKMRDEVPDLQRKPSEYLKTNLWYATQPVEEPEHPDDLRKVFEWIGWDRMVYSSDYPHWDFDDPHLAWRFQMTEVEKRNLLHDNALAVYPFK